MDTALQSHDRILHRLAQAAVGAAVPLVLFGGSVTTLGAGMAVEGWLIAEGHFLLFFPVDRWLRDVGTFVEHTHRLFGVLVGLVAVLACGRALLARGARAAVLPGVALLCVCAQGALGGFRVLENSPDLAFLHGVFAQATLAVLALSAAAASGAWASARRTGAPGLALPAALATVLVLAQCALGAWYRHGLRPSPEPDAALRLELHLAGAAAATAAVVLLARACRRAAARAEGAGAAVLSGHARRLHALLGLQVLLGLLAWAGYRPDAIGPAEWTLSVLHVLGGALLLAQCAVTLAWARRLSHPRGAAVPALEGL